MNIDYVNRIYNDKVEILSQTGIRSSHFDHVAKNLLNSMFSTGADYDSRRSAYLSNFIALRRYFRLLENYPDFKEAELNIHMKDGGYFGNLDLNIISDQLGLQDKGASIVYVEYASRMLLGSRKTDA